MLRRDIFVGAGKHRCTVCEVLLSVCEGDPCFVCKRLAEEEEHERELGVRTFEAQRWRQRQRENRELVSQFRRRKVLGR
jgi:hypothetical protein